MSSKEKIYLVGFIYCIMAYANTSGATSFIFGTMMVLAAYQFISCPTMRATDAEDSAASQAESNAETMDKEKIRKELYEKVNEWFTEQPQRPIAQFMIETMWQYIEAAQHHMHSDAATPSEDGRCPACGEYIKHVCLAE